MAWDVGVRQLSRLFQQESLDWAVTNPYQTAILAGVLVLLVVVAWYLLRWYRRPAGERLRRILAHEEEISILLHPNPDPDAMAAAMGVAYLADLAGTDSVLRFPGEIRHQENRAFRTILDLELDVLESAGEIADDAVILVDHNVPRGFTNAEQIEPIAVVDHHPGDGSGVSFTDVRPEYGASATIIAEYLESVGAETADPEKDTDQLASVIPTDVATGLIYGILSDTKNLTKGCSDAEFAAAAFLYPGVDHELLDRIANPQVDSEVLEVKARAITERRIDGPFAVSDVDEVSNVDAIPQAADELSKLEGVTAVVVAGRKNGTLHLSGRSRDDRVHMGKALERAVEGIPQAGAGGHARMGGGQISIEHMEGLGPGSGVSMAELEDRILRSLAGEEVVQPAD